MQFLSLAFAGVPPPVTYLVENKCQSELLSNQQAPLRLGNPAHHPYIGFPKEKRQKEQEGRTRNQSHRHPAAGKRLCQQSYGTTQRQEKAQSRKAVKG